MAELKLEDGVVVTGTAEEIGELISKLKGGKIPEGYYLSESKGLIKIEDMHKAHIANTIMKIYRKWAVSLKLANFPTPSHFIAALEAGFVDEPYVKPLFAQLYKHKDDPDWKD